MVVVVVVVVVVVIVVVIVVVVKEAAAITQSSYESQRPPRQPGSDRFPLMGMREAVSLSRRSGVCLDTHY